MNSGQIVMEVWSKHCIRKKSFSGSIHLYFPDWEVHSLSCVSNVLLFFHNWTGALLWVTGVPEGRTHSQQFRVSWHLSPKGSYHAKELGWREHWSLVVISHPHWHPQDILVPSMASEPDPSKSLPCPPFWVCWLSGMAHGSWVHGKCPASLVSLWLHWDPLGKGECGFPLP